jgi:hypothetical protein
MPKGWIEGDFIPLEALDFRKLAAFGPGSPEIPGVTNIHFYAGTA